MMLLPGRMLIKRDGSHYSGRAPAYSCASVLFDLCLQKLLEKKDTHQESHQPLEMQL